MPTAPTPNWIIKKQDTLSKWCSCTPTIKAEGTETSEATEIGGYSGTCRKPINDSTGSLACWRDSPGVTRPASGDLVDT